MPCDKLIIPSSSISSVLEVALLDNCSRFISLTLSIRTCAARQGVVGDIGTAPHGDRLLRESRGTYRQIEVLNIERKGMQIERFRDARREDIFAQQEPKDARERGGHRWSSA